MAHIPTIAECTANPCLEGCPLSCTEGCFRVTVQPCNLLCNTDFECPRIPGESFTFQFPKADVPCWNTTQAEIEYWRTGSGVVGPNVAFSGTQWAELNADSAAPFFQSFTLLVASSVIQLSFAHAGRMGCGGTNTMEVTIRSGVDTLDPNGLPLIYQAPGNRPGNLYDANYELDGVTIKDVRLWSFHTVNVPLLAPGTYTLIFNAVGGAACGNFLDSVALTDSTSSVSATSNSPVSIGGVVTLVATTFVGGTFSWNGPNSYTSTDQNPFFTATNINQSGVYTVTYTDPDGCVSFATTTVVITDCAISITTSSNTPVLVGNLITLTSTVVGGTAPFVFSWVGPNLYTSSLEDPTPFLATNINQTGPYTVTVTDAEECSISSEINLTVFECDVTVTVSTTSPVTIGSTVYLTAIVVGGTAPFTYLWSGPDGFTSIISNPSFIVTSILQAGGYSVVVTDSNGCTDSAFNIVNVCDNFVTASNNGPIALGDTINLTTVTSPGALSYSWVGPGFISNLQNPSILNAVALMGGLYTVTVTFDGIWALVNDVLIQLPGCIKSSSTTVIILPCSLSIIASSNSPITIGGSINLSSVTSGGVAPFTYLWSGPLLYGSFLEDPLPFFATTPNQTGPYTVTVTDANNCVAYDEIYVIILCDLTVTAGGNSPVALGASIFLTATSILGATYSWTGPGFSSILQNPIILNATSGMGGLYTVTATLGDCSAVSTRMIEILPCDTTVIAGSNSPVTGGAVLQLTSIPVNGVGPYSYSWTGPDAFSSTLQNPFFTITSLLQEGLYTVEITDSNGCVATHDVYVIIIACYIITDCNPNGPPPFITSFDLSEYDGKIIRFCSGLTPWPDDCYCATVTKTLDCTEDPIIECPELNITSSYTDINYSTSLLVGTATYTIEVWDSTESILINSVTSIETGPGVLSGLIAGLTSGTLYKVKLIIITATETLDCPFQDVWTTSFS